MTVYTLNPVNDPRWSAFVREHAWASVFHRPAWSAALQRTYGFEPVVYTTSGPDCALANGVTVCRISSWLTGRRLVSLPFADHCDPLVTGPEDWGHLLGRLSEACRGHNYCELRSRHSVHAADPRLSLAASFYLHTLDLRPPVEQLFRRAHASTVQRKIRKAEREHIGYERGRSRGIAEAFYALMLLTRRRQGLPPQPREWFANLIECFGEDADIRVAYFRGRPIGSIFTLRHCKTLVYKYGCSDARFHHLGTMPFLFWRAIVEGKESGAETLDLGRSDTTNMGLMTFKERLGATRSVLEYIRCGKAPRKVRRSAPHLPLWLTNHAPDWLMVAAGRLLYPHVA